MEDFLHRSRVSILRCSSVTLPLAVSLRDYRMIAPGYNLGFLYLGSEEKQKSTESKARAPLLPGLGANATDYSPP